MEKNSFSFLRRIFKGYLYIEQNYVCNNFHLTQPTNFSNFHKHRSVAGVDICNLHVLRERLGFTQLQGTVLRLGSVWWPSLRSTYGSDTSDLQ